MSHSPPEPLDREAFPWLLATAAAATLPHASHQPLWLILLAAAAFATAAALWRRGLPSPSRWVMVLAVIAACTALIFEFRTLLGRDAGVAMLVLFMALKLLEVRRLRDAHVVVVLSFFLLLTHYFYSQSIATGLWLLAALVVATATLVRLHGGPTCTLRACLRHAGVLLLQASPFMVLLYLLFPRVSGPLWGLPQDARSARSGLPEQVAPGSIANLVLSPEIAFRARFASPVPDNDGLYWRGPVLERFDGAVWHRMRHAGPEPTVRAEGPVVAYEMTLEPHQQAWLLALDAPVKLPPGAILSPELALVAREAVRQRQRYRVESATAYRFNTEESPETRQRNLELPTTGNPRARALAARWRAEGGSDGEVLARALDLFARGGFVYTLQPPLLGPDGVDDFLFSTRRGFCEHYASAFAFLMRAAGVPARVVGGYLGGEANPVDDYWVVRQADAHAWTEIWQPGRGWVRVDPTAAAAPARIESGLTGAVPAGDPLPALPRIDAAWLRDIRYRWEALNNTWNQVVLGYNPDRQRDLLTWLGLPDADWRSLVALLAGACGVGLLLLVLWAVAARPPRDPALRLWRRGLARLARQRLAPTTGETPLAFARRVEAERPHLAPSVERFALAYCTTRYGPLTQLNELRAALAALP